MRMGAFRFRMVVTLAVCCVSSFLLACPVGTMRMLIPDFFTNDVRGVQVYRVDDQSGALVDAGRIEFIEIEVRPRGEQLKYQQVTPAGEISFGPMYTKLSRDPTAADGVEIKLAFLNQSTPGWFRVASYNLDGTSSPSLAQAYIEVGEEG